MPQPLAFNNEGIQFAWDQTSLSYAMNCLKKYQYIMLDGWKPQRQNDHFIFGGAYATALEHFHKHRANGVEYDDAVIEVVGEALVLTWHDGAPWQSLHSTKTRENLIRTIVWYLEHFRDDPTPTVILSDGSPAVEHSFALPVDNGIILTGHLDRMVEYAGKTYIQDQKTTGTTISPYYFRQYTMDNQMFQYTFAGKMIFGLPISGVMIDAAQVAVGFSRFERSFIFIDSAQLEEWYDDTMEYIFKVQQHTRENHFPRNRTSCNDYGGCDFREICNKAPKVRDNFLRAEFVKGKRWDPLESR